MPWGSIRRGDPSSDTPPRHTRPGGIVKPENLERDLSDWVSFPPKTNLSRRLARARVLLPLLKSKKGSMDREVVVPLPYPK